MLEEDVAVFMAAAGLGVLGVERLGAELGHGVHVAHFLQVFVVPLFDLLDLVGGAEAVEEVDKGNAALNGGQVGHRGQVHDLLGVGLGQHGETGLPGGVHVAVVTEDVQRLGGDGTGRHIEHAGQALRRDLVHVGDHQQQALGSGEGGGDGAGAKRTVNSAGGAGLGLHLNNLDLVAEDVLQARRAPLVNGVGHGAGGGDGVDGSNVGERIGYMRGRGIAIHGLFRSRHFSSSVYCGAAGGTAPGAPGFSTRTGQTGRDPGFFKRGARPCLRRNTRRRRIRAARRRILKSKVLLLVLILPNFKAVRKVGLHRKMHKYFDIYLAN